jgi:predicted porin
MLLNSGRQRMTRTSKKLSVLALATASCFTGYAYAQTNVTVYGKLYPQVTHYSISKGTAAGTPVSTLSRSVGTTPEKLSGTLMEASNSRLGFRGTEKLGNGMTAMFQLETTVRVDDGLQSSSGVLFNRDTFVGLEGGFGRVRMGRMDTIYKQVTDTLGFMGIHSGNFVSPSNILAARGFGSNNAHRFHERPSNTIDYQSPEFGAFQLYAGYSFGEVAGAVSDRTIVSTGVTYEQGPVYLALAHEQHHGLYGGSRNVPSALRNLAGGSSTGASFVAAPGTDSKDTSTRASALYKFTKATRAEVNFAVTKLSETGGTAGKFRDYKQNNWHIGVEHKMGPWTFASGYGQASEGSCSRVGGVACSTEGLDGKMLTLGAMYSFSKRTALFALASRLNNGKSASYSNVGDAPEPDTGQDMNQVAVGILHSF